MKKYSILLVVVLVLAVLGYLFASGKNGSPRDLNKEDQQVQVEDTAKDNHAQPHDREVFPKTKMGDLLRNHMMILAMPAETIEEADRKFMASLAELKRNPAEAVSLLNEAYKKTEARHYFNRWGLVKTLGDLGSNLATQSLAGIANAKVPAETNRDTHHFSSQEEEVIIRIRAVEGLGLLAAGGDKNAERALYQLAIEPTNKNSAIQRRAIKAYLRGGQDTGEKIKTLKARLPKNLHDIITVSVTKPEEFAQKMEGVKQVSRDSTNKEKIEKPTPATSAPKTKTN